jgi:hypothetical protein
MSDKQELTFTKNATKRSLELQKETLLASTETSSKISKTRQSRREPAAIFAPKRTPQVAQTTKISTREENINSTRLLNNAIQADSKNINQTQEDCVNLKIDVNSS